LVHLSYPILQNAITVFLLGDESFDIDSMFFCRNEAPRTCTNFRELAARGYYNGCIFHRIVKVRVDVCSLLPTIGSLNVCLARGRTLLFNLVIPPAPDAVVPLFTGMSICSLSSKFVWTIIIFISPWTRRAKFEDEFSPKLKHVGAGVRFELDFQQVVSVLILMCCQFRF
jgi:hypothetical protein